VSVTDSLTGLWNRRYLANEIPKDLAVIRRARVDYREFTSDDPRQSDRLRHAIASHRFELGNGDTVRLSCSVGFSFYPFMRSAPSLFSWEQVLDLADRALYRAKQGGRNQWVGVVGAPDADPAVALQRKDEDLDKLAEDGILELHAKCLDPTTPDHTDRVPPTRSTPRPVEHAN
jgi:GGDEF domain-containing protein